MRIIADDEACVGSDQVSLAQDEQIAADDLRRRDNARPSIADYASPRRGHLRQGSDSLFGPIFLKETDYCVENHDSNDDYSIEPLAKRRGDGRRTDQHPDYEAAELSQKQVDERSEGPGHGAGDSSLAYRPSARGRKGVAANLGGTGSRISARAGAARDTQARGRAGTQALAVQAGEFIYEQPAAGDVEYTFKHALTQEVAYSALLVERRKLLHERAGLALESMFAEQLDDHLGELAHHYSRSDNAGKAVEYRAGAGEQALQRSAYADAIGNLSAGLNLLQRLPDSPERIRQELLLQLALGPALVAVKGRAAPEVACAYVRARELCERLGDPPDVFPACLGCGPFIYCEASYGYRHSHASPGSHGLHRAHVCDRFFAVLPVLEPGGRGTGSRRPSPSATVASVTASARSSKSTRGCPRRALDVMQFCDSCLYLSRPAILA